jgi:hypothetical protein
VSPVPKRGVTPAAAAKLLLALPDIEEGSSYGMPAFKLKGKFFARFRDQDAVLVWQIGSIEERDVLMQLEPRVFFFTEHYRDYPAVLIRLAEIPRPMLTDILKDAWDALSARRRPTAKRKPRG